MAAATMASNQLDTLPQPSSQPNSPSALYTSFNQPPRSASSAMYSASSTMYSARSQSSLPGTPTSSTYTGTILDLPSGMNYPEFLRTWTDSHISTWLTNIKCGHHATIFRASDIRGDVLLDLDHTTLKEIGIASVGDRLRILNAVKSLRQRCSNRAERSPTSAQLRPRVVLNANDDDLALRRTGSTTDPTSRLAPRRQEHSRPPPLQLGSSAHPQPNLPHIIRDNSDSSRSNHARPLPNPSTTSSSPTPPLSTPGISQSTSSRAPNFPLPPIPRPYPPGPPQTPSTSSSVRPGNRPLQGRKTPTQFDAPEFTSQPLPPAPSLLTPQSTGTWAGYGLPPDPKAGIHNARSPRSQSPLLNPPLRPSTRSPVPTHARNLSSGSQGSPTPIKPNQRPSGPSHPYAQGLQPSSQSVNVLSPIEESFPSQLTPVQPNAPSTSPSPPSSFAVGRGPFANPSSTNTHPSLVDLRRKLVKFMLGDEGHSATINVEDCVGGVEVLEKVLKKFGKLSARNAESDGPDRAGTNDGGLSVDGWCVFLDWGNETSQGAYFCTLYLFVLLSFHRSPSYRGPTSFSLSCPSERSRPRARLDFTACC